METIMVINRTEKRDANIIMAQTGLAEVGVIKSLQIETLRERMKNNVAHFLYQKVDKKDGQTVIREAWGTLSEPLMRSKVRNPYTSSPQVQVYYDIERGAFRSFRKCNFITLLSGTPATGGTTEDREENIKRLLNFFPVLGEDDEGRMIELDAAQVLSTTLSRIRSSRKNTVLSWLQRATTPSISRNSMNSHILRAPMLSHPLNLKD